MNEQEILNKLIELKNKYRQDMENNKEFYKLHESYNISDQGTYHGIILAINAITSDISINELLGINE